MEEEFYSTIKLVSGEEIIAKVSYVPDDDVLIIDNPLQVHRIDKRSNGLDGFILKEWIHATYDTMFIIPKSSIITMTELDKKIKNYYLKSIDNSLNDDDDSINVRPNKLTKRMGYLGSVNETKKYLEDIFKRS